LSRPLFFFPIEQKLLEFQTPSKPAETLGSHNPVSWEDQGEGVLAHGLAHGSGGAGLSDGSGHLAIGSGPAKGYLGNGPPNFFLKRGGNQIHGKILGQGLVYQCGLHGLQDGLIGLTIFANSCVRVKGMKIIPAIHNRIETYSHP
jgi:hypothetical protein